MVGCCRSIQPERPTLTQPQLKPQASQADAHAEVSNALHAEFRSDLTVDTLRLAFDSLTSLLNVHGPEPYAQHRGITFGAGSATLDVMVPAGAGPHPVLVYLHGGAWMAGSPASHRKLTARFVEAGLLVVSVDYRLAPEHPFPAGFDDCVAAVCWAADNARHYGGDPSRLFVAGDSAGANLAAASAIALGRRRRGPRPAALLLIYGVFDMADLGAGSATRSIHKAYLPGPRIEALRDPRVSPIHAAAELPPSFIVVGRQDPLLEQSRQLQAALAAAGTTHEYVEVPGQPHGFMQMEFLGGVRALIRDMAAFLHARPATPAPERAWWRRIPTHFPRRFPRGLP